jgi:hypothetical protein
VLNNGNQPFSSLTITTRIRPPAHGNCTSNRWKTKELREVLNVPPGSFSFDFKQ